MIRIEMKFKSNNFLNLVYFNLIFRKEVVNIYCKENLFFFVSYLLMFNFFDLYKIYCNIYFVKYYRYYIFRKYIVII